MSLLDMTDDELRAEVARLQDEMSDISNERDVAMDAFRARLAPLKERYAQAVAIAQTTPEARSSIAQVMRASGIESSEAFGVPGR